MTIKERKTREVCTAVAVGNDLETPLLSQADESSTRKNPDDEVTAMYTCFRWHGALVGYLVQLLNISGTTVMFYNWGREGVLSNLEHPLDSLFHLLVWIFTQADLALYIVMWMSLTAVLTERGMNYVRRNYFQSNPSKRAVFVLGIQFYVGVVVGVFLAWVTIDSLLGLPVPVLPMVGVLVFGLCISYTMIWCYDLEDDEEVAAEAKEESVGTSVC